MRAWEFPILRLHGTEQLQYSIFDMISEVKNEINKKIEELQKNGRENLYKVLKAFYLTFSMERNKLKV